MFVRYFENFMNQSLRGFLDQELLTEGADWLLISIILKASWIIALRACYLQRGLNDCDRPDSSSGPFWQILPHETWPAAPGVEEHILTMEERGKKHIHNGRKEPFELEIEKSPSKQELCHFVAAPWRQSQPPQKAKGGWTEHTRAGNQEIWVILCSSGKKRYKTSKNLVRMRPEGWTEHTRAGDFFLLKLFSFKVYFQ